MSSIMEFFGALNYFTSHRVGKDEESLRIDYLFQRINKKLFKQRNNFDAALDLIIGMRAIIIAQHVELEKLRARRNKFLFGLGGDQLYMDYTSAPEYCTATMLSGEVGVIFRKLFPEVPENSSFVIRECVADSEFSLVQFAWKDPSP